TLKNVVHQPLWCVEVIERISQTVAHQIRHRLMPYSCSRFERVAVEQIVVEPERLFVEPHKGVVIELGRLVRFESRRSRHGTAPEKASAHSRYEYSCEPPGPSAPHGRHHGSSSRPALEKASARCHQFER